jgi:hypothetical protein
VDVFAPGVAPILADAVVYIGIVVIGHAVMRLIAAPSRADRLARRRIISFPTVRRTPPLTRFAAFPSCVAFIVRACL